jgi:hypothetical protein
MPAKTNGHKGRSSYGQRPVSSIVYELLVGLAIAVVLNFLLYGTFGTVSQWICLVIGGALILHALCSVFAKIRRQFGGGPVIMTIVCLAAVLAVPAIAQADSPPGCDSFGCYTIYKSVAPTGVTTLTANGLPPVGCRTVVGWSTGTYPTLVISLSPFSFRFADDYTWPVSLTSCWEGGWRVQGSKAVVLWQRLHSVRVNKDLPWQNVNTGVVKGYRYVSTERVWNADHSCVTVRVHAEVRLGIPAIPHLFLPPEFVTKPWIEFDNVCKDGSVGPVRHDNEPA